jgi:glycosyltransferase involved in cell wall biosynthesis
MTALVPVHAPETSRATARAVGLSVVLPCYNEEKNIPLIFDRLRPLLAGRDDVEIILVNNGSTDGSADVFAEEMTKAAADLPTVRVCTVPVNQGYGYGIMSGVREARGEFIAWTHADMQTDLGDVLAGWEKVRREPDPERVFLKGRRMGRPLFDDLFTRGMAVVASVALGEWLFDINAQPKLFHHDFLVHLASPPDDFALDVYAFYQAKRQGLKLIEQEVHFGKRRFGEAKGGGTLRGKVKLVKRTWGYLWALRGHLRRGGEI